MSNHSPTAVTVERGEAASKGDDAQVVAKPADLEASNRVVMATNTPP